MHACNINMLSSNQFHLELLDRRIQLIIAPQLLITFRSPLAYIACVIRPWDGSVPNDSAGGEYPPLKACLIGVGEIQVVLPSVLDPSNKMNSSWF